MPDTLFTRFPLADEPVATSAGPQPTPYHIYDGHLLLIGGTADLAAVEALLAPESMAPVRTASGRSPMGVWVADEPEASHGAHREAQVSFYVTPEPVAPIADSPFALLRFLLREPTARQMCHGLWNDTEAVVAYNREVLGLSPRLAEISFEAGDGRVRFSATDTESGAPILRGDVRQRRRSSFAASKALFQSFGLIGALEAAATKEVEVTVTNPVSEALPRNADARTVSRPETLIAEVFDPAQDRLELLAPPYAELDFRPDFVEHMLGLRFVYLPPETRGADAD